MYSKKVSVEELSSMIDHTNLKPFTIKNEINKLCEEAIDYNFAAVCVNPTNVSLCYKILKGTDVEVATVVGFPLGANITEIKALETKEAVNLGAQEIDMVMNIGGFRDKNYREVSEDIQAVVKAAEGNTVKVILETGFLTDDQIVKACEIVKNSGAQFVKTSTGFGPMGAFYDHVLLMRQTVGNDFGVKAAGGIKDARTAVRLVNAGANRLGASAGVQIINSLVKIEEEGRWFDATEDKPTNIYSFGAADLKKQPKDVYDFYIRKREDY